jgi:predicted nucleic acid-binding protein
MPKNIVSDTSCLILLDKLGRIGLLKSLFGEITITTIIADEFGKEIPEFIRIEDPKDKNYQRIVESFLDPGEASAIALALEYEECLLILDDYKGRREAKQLKLDYTGTIGILLIAKEKGLINSFTEIIDDIKKTNFRISDEIIKEAKKKSGE